MPGGDTSGWGPQLLTWTKSFTNFAQVGVRSRLLLLWTQQLLAASRTALNTLSAQVVSQNQLWGWSQDTVKAAGWLWLYCYVLCTEAGCMLCRWMCPAPGPRWRAF